MRERDRIQIATVVDRLHGIVKARVEFVAVDRPRDAGAAVATQPRHWDLVLLRIGDWLTFVLAGLDLPKAGQHRDGLAQRLGQAVSGDPMNAIPTPKLLSGNANRQTGVVALIAIDSQVNEMDTSAKPNPMTGRGCERSTIRPTTGANTPVATAIGAVSSAERVGDNPHPVCA